MADDPRPGPDPMHALVGGVVALALVGVWLLWSADDPPRPAPAAVPAPVRAADPPARGDVPVAPVPMRDVQAPTDSPEVERLPITSLPLRLLATSVQPEGAPSFARIVDSQHDTDELMIEGQVFALRPDVTLLSVEADSVVLDNYGTKERLPLDPEGMQLFGADALEAVEESGLALDDEERARRRDLGGRLRDITDAGADRERTRARGGLMAEADVAPVYRDGEMVGLELGEVRPGGFYDRAGLRAGDVVTSINGVDLGGDQAVTKLITMLGTSEQVEVAVERSDGSVEVVSMSLEDLVREMEADAGR